MTATNPMNINPNFDIQSGNIVLSGVENFVKCSVCGQTMAICYEDKILIKTFVTLLDIRNDIIVLKCGKCKTFNSIAVKIANTKKSKCLIMM